MTITLTIISYILERVRDQGGGRYNDIRSYGGQNIPDGEQLDRAKMFFHRGAVIDSSIYYAKNMGATG